MDVKEMASPSSPLAVQMIQKPRSSIRGLHRAREPQRGAQEEEKRSYADQRSINSDTYTAVRQSRAQGALDLP